MLILNYKIFIFTAFISYAASDNLNNDSSNDSPRDHFINANNIDNALNTLTTKSDISDKREISENLVQPTNNDVPSLSKRFDFVDNSRTAIDKLKEMISTGNYSDIFGRSFDELQSNLVVDQIMPIEGSISQQSNSYTFRTQKKGASNDKFLYVSNPENHTSQNCYIVKVKSSVEKSLFEKLHEVFGMIDAKVYKKYLHGFLGYSICFPENTLPLALMKEIPSIEFIERDNIVKASQIQENAPWGLARLSSPHIGSTYYNFDGTGEGVNVYVLDSGLSKTKGIIFVVIFNFY